ncbi:MAG TPA: thioesterase family protein, partial [Acidimicrobiales bacterium]|nr:thioesterase family protein [Acidimicrobiales bacterium]
PAGPPPMITKRSAMPPAYGLARVGLILSRRAWMSAMHAFDADTAIRPVGPGEVEADMHAHWWVQRGPNGGFVAAQLLRAMAAEHGDPARSCRSMTIHYVSPPALRPVRIFAEVVRAGRSLTTMSARMVQDGEVRALALASFSTSRPSYEMIELEAPAWPPVAEVAVLERPDVAPPVVSNYEVRNTLGVPFSGGEPETGGWIALAGGDRPLDQIAVAAITDGWLPAIYAHTTAPTFAVPTVDLTIHFRAPIPEGLIHCGVEFRTRLATDGFLEEDGLVFTPDGQILAQSRQLAVLLPTP